MGDVAWAERSLGVIAVVALGTLLVGVGEELAIRGILLTAVRARHGEFVTLLVTALVFALAHIPGSIISGLPMAFIALQVGGLAIAGSTYYWIRRVTGRLWVGILVHAFTDWVLYLGAASTVPAASMPQDHKASTDGVTGYIEIVLWIALTIRSRQRHPRGPTEQATRSPPERAAPTVGVVDRPALRPATGSRPSAPTASPSTSSTWLRKSWRIFRDAQGATLTVRSGIEATGAVGFDEARVRTVSRNAQTLCFDESRFEET